MAHSGVPSSFLIPESEGALHCACAPPVQVMEQPAQPLVAPTLHEVGSGGGAAGAGCCGPRCWTRSLRLRPRPPRRCGFRSCRTSHGPAWRRRPTRWRLSYIGDRGRGRLRMPQVGRVLGLLRRIGRIAIIRATGRGNGGLSGGGGYECRCTNESYQKVTTSHVFSRK